MRSRWIGLVGGVVLLAASCGWVDRAEDGRGTSPEGSRPAGQGQDLDEVVRKLGELDPACDARISEPSETQASGFADPPSAVFRCRVSGVEISGMVFDDAEGHRKGVEVVRAHLCRSGAPAAMTFLADGLWIVVADPTSSSAGDVTPVVARALSAAQHDLSCPLDELD